MADSRIIPINPGSDLNNIINQAAQTLQSQGFNVSVQMYSPVNAGMTVKKDRDGFKDFIGFGIECRVSLAIVNAGQLSVTIDSEWTNKIIALVIGWFLCLVPFICGIVGCINQSGLPEKIYTALAASAPTGYGQATTNNYQPPVNNYQPPVNNYQPPVNNYQPPVNEQPADNSTNQ